MIQTTCAKCGKSYQLPDAAAGKKAKCKACGAVMAIPAAAPADDDPLGLGGAPSPGGGDLSSLYGSTPEPTAEAPPAFNPAASFTNAPRRSSGPPMKLIIGLAGGAVGLIVVVILAAALVGGGGGDDKEDDGPGGLAITGGSVPGGGTSADPETDDTDDEDDGNKLEVESFGGTAVLPPEESELVDWTLPPSASAEAMMQRVVFRGLALRVPLDWAYEIETYTEVTQDTTEQLGDSGFDFVDQDSETTRLMVELEENRALSVFVSKLPEGSEDWPALFRVDEMLLEMTLSPDEFERFDELAKNGTDRQQFTAGFIRGAAEEKMLDLVVAFAFSEPVGFYLNDRLVESVEFGTLLGGHRFVRLEAEDSQGVHSIAYIGTVGDLRVQLVADSLAGDEQLRTEFERLLRTAELAPEVEAVAAAQEQGDDAYLGWIDDGGVEVLFSGAPAPLPDLAAADWSGGDTPVFVGLGRPDLVAPTGKPLGIVVPEPLEVISTTRAAVRTRPMDDGTWLTLEVHKLTGLDRRAVDLIDESDGTVLMRGQRVALPEAAEVSELASEAFTIQRLLQPALPGQGVREVVYVMKEGAYLVTVIGRYPADQPAWLETFDTAAMSVQKMPEQDEEDDGFKFEFELKDDEEEQGNQ